MIAHPLSKPRRSPNTPPNMGPIKSPIDMAAFIKAELRLAAVSY